MNHSGRPLLGLCPAGKFVFSHEDAVRQKELLRQKLRDWNVRFVDLEEVLPDGLVRDVEHVRPAVEHFRQARVDCLFLPHCNFGTEHAAALIARHLGVPVLLWGPRDEAPLADGTRLRDTLCGMFATSKVLRKLGVVFSYVENCRVDEPALREGVERFLRGVNVADALRTGLRIGHLGQRIDFFWTTIVNESELLERFRVEVLPLDMVEFVRRVKERARRHRAEYVKEVGELRNQCVVEGLSDEAFVNVLAVRDQMLALAKEHELDGFAIQDFMSLVDETGAWCFYADSVVAERYAVGYESDIHGAVSCALLRRATFEEQPAFLADLTVRHPEDDNTVLLWHAGAPLSMKHPSAKVRLGTHWILPSPVSGMTHFRLKDGPVTIARFDGENGDYQLAVGEGETTEGPATQNNYAWMRVNHWPSWERTLMEGPFIHHAAMIYGHYEEALVEAAKFVPELKIVRLK